LSYLCPRKQETSLTYLILRTMIRNKWSVETRNKLAQLAMECDSCAAIEGAKMTSREREELQTLIRKALDYIDKRI